MCSAIWFRIISLFMGAIFKARAVNAQVTRGAPIHPRHAREHEILGDARDA